MAFFSVFNGDSYLGACGSGLGAFATFLPACGATWVFAHALGYERPVQLLHQLCVCGCSADGTFVGDTVVRCAFSGSAAAATPKNLDSDFGSGTATWLTARAGWAGVVVVACVGSVGSTSADGSFSRFFGAMEFDLKSLLRLMVSEFMDVVTLGSRACARWLVR